MPTRKLKKPAEGAQIKESANMKAWREEFDQIDLAEHKAKLKALGLDDEEKKSLQKQLRKKQLKNN
jgi:hypothetical protein